MNTLIPNFAARLAASSPAAPADYASSAVANGDGTSNSGASFSAHLRQQNEQASSTPERSAHDQASPAEGSAHRTRKSADGTKAAAADGNSLPLPGALPPVVPGAAAAVAAAAIGPGGAADARADEPGPVGAPQAPGLGLTSATSTTASSIASAAAAQLDTADTDGPDATQPGAEPPASAAVADSAAVAAGAKALANVAQLKLAAAAATATAKADAAATATAATTAASVAAAPPRPLPRDVSIKIGRPVALDAGTGRPDSGAIDLAATVTAQDGAGPALRAAPDTAATIALAEATVSSKARDGSGDGAPFVKQDDLPAVDAASATPGVPLVPLLDPTGGIAAPAVPATIPSAPAVHVPVGSPEWGKQVGESVAWAANQKLTHATISLNPDHLGPLEIRLSLVGGEASVAFATHSHAAAAALQASSTQLRDMLSQAGFTQVNVDVSQQSGKQQSFAGSAYRESGGGSDKPAAAVDAISAPPRTVSRSQVDAYA